MTKHARSVRRSGVFCQIGSHARTDPFASCKSLSPWRLGGRTVGDHKAGQETLKSVQLRALEPGLILDTHDVLTYITRR